MVKIKSNVKVFRIRSSFQLNAKSLRAKKKIQPNKQDVFVKHQWPRWQQYIKQLFLKYNIYGQGRKIIGPDIFWKVLISNACKINMEFQSLMVQNLWPS